MALCDSFNAVQKLVSHVTESATLWVLNATQYHHHGKRTQFLEIAFCKPVKFTIHFHINDFSLFTYAGLGSQCHATKKPASRGLDTARTFKTMGTKLLTATSQLT